ncbi:ATP-binding protein [Streptomyces spongiicola]|uniref:histidine kinase n=1 Tax=Streptomyces spongiicola TaxID=1690221 RepID=A0ABM6VAM6_9ACTN|nr:ATP-binding protein [Streptomyces spongiicola]AWK11053.1 ATP-binding protein [Streptomyces spongiicola]
MDDERGPLRASLFALLATALVSSATVVFATAAAPEEARSALGWAMGAGAVLLCCAVALATHAVQSSRILQLRLMATAQDADGLRRDREALSAEMAKERSRLTGELSWRTEELTREHARLAEELRSERERLTAEHIRERDRINAEHVLERGQLMQDHTRERRQLVDEHTRERERMLEEHTRERETLAEENARLVAQSRRAVADRASALSACAKSAGRMQALITSMLADLREMEERHTDERALGDLLHLDHRAAQAGRLADSIAVLTGSRSGRRWARPIGMESVLRGAMSRIAGYQRVRVHSVSEVAVAGHAAEGVIHTIAELLDNAANFSPPTAEVHVYVEEVPAGAIVSVEDSGLVMGEVQLRRAMHAVSGDVTDLGGLSGTRLGLAVVGRLARKHGLTVSFRPSARGGTGVLVLIPHELLSRPAGRDGRVGAAPGAPSVASRAPRSTPGALPVTVPAQRRALPGAAVPAQARSSDDRRPAPPVRPQPAPAGAPEPAAADPGRLPRRRRGQTLAAAESTRPAPPDPETSPPRDVKSGIARFSSFRQAVRTAPGDDTTAPPDPDDIAPTTLPGRAPATSSHPEGDTPR